MYVPRKVGTSHMRYNNQDYVIQDDSGRKLIFLEAILLMSEKKFLWRLSFSRVTIIILNIVLSFKCYFISTNYRYLSPTGHFIEGLSSWHSCFMVWTLQNLNMSQAHSALDTFNYWNACQFQWKANQYCYRQARWGPRANCHEWLMNIKLSRLS